MENNTLANTDEFAFSTSSGLLDSEAADTFALSYLSYSDEQIPFGAMQKLQSALGSGSGELKAYAANVLIGNVPAKKVNECVGEGFTLYGFHAKKVKFKNSGRDGMYTVMFGTSDKGICAYWSASDKIYESLINILYVYGDVSQWENGIPVKIRMNEVSNGKAYCLEIIG